MLTTTIYDQANATITGTYHTYRGECITVEFVGTALECIEYILSIRTFDDGSNEVQHVTIQDKADTTPVATEFALHNQWASVVGA